MDFREVYDKIFDCVAVYQPVKRGKEFIFVEFNKAAEKTEKIKRKDLLGKSVQSVFPGVIEFGLLEVLRRVNETGRSESFPMQYYEDERIKGWRENQVSKLSDGNILVVYKDLTKEKQKEEQLRLKESRFREFIELLPEIVCEADLDGKILLVNRNALRKFQLTQKDLDSGTTLDQLFVKKDLVRALRHLKSKIEGKDIPPEEYMVKRKDGTTFPVLTYFSVSFKGKVPKRIRGVMMDISERKRHEKELELEKAYLEKLISDAPEAIVQCTGQSTIRQINIEFTRLFGFTHEEAIGKDVDILLTRGNSLEEARSVTRYVSEGHKVFRETLRYHKDGTPINVSILATPVLLNDEHVGVYGIYRDITERKKSEKIQQLTNNISTAVLTSKNLEELLDIIWKELSLVVDTTNLFIAFYNKEEHTLSFPFFADEKDKFEKVPADNTITGYVIKTNKPVLLTSKDIEILEKAGEVELVGSPSKIWLGVPLQTSGEVFGVISLQSYDDDEAFTEEDLDVLVFISNQISLAISKLKSEEELREAKQKAEEAAVAKEQFLSTMSHEIRTPLNAVIGMSQLLMSLNPRPDQLDFLTALKFSGENLLSLINDILDLTKLDAGKMDIETVPMDLKKLTSEIISTLNIKAKERNNSIELHSADDVPDEVLGDHMRLGQILNNLIGNAIKFTKNGTITVRISVSEIKDSIYKVKISIEDTGIGISKEKQKLIFESFTQEKADTTRKYGGSGLGLAITKRLIDLQEGEIWVESKTNVGSKFICIIPYKIHKKIRRKKAVIQQEKSIDLTGKKILMVEDNEINRLVARKFLESWGIEVTEAENGKVALDFMQDHEFDLVLMDLQMPVMDGYQTTKMIKSMDGGRLKKLPIIALTASILIDVKDKVAEAGLDDFLIKPFNAPDLNKMIWNHLNKSSS